MIDHRLTEVLRQNQNSQSWLMDAVRWTVDFSQDLAPIPRIEVLEEVARVYGLLGCHRKVAFFMQLRAGIMKDELARHGCVYN